MVEVLGGFRDGETDILLCGGGREGRCVGTNTLDDICNGGLFFTTLRWLQGIDHLSSRLTVLSNAILNWVRPTPQLCSPNEGLTIDMGER
jgi:hypothetical protein